MFTSSVGSGRSADLGQSRFPIPALVDLPLSLPLPRLPSDSFSSTQRTCSNNPGDYFASIVEQHDAFAILKGRTDQDISKYVDLSDEELTAIIKLRLFVRATGIVLIRFVHPSLVVEADSYTRQR